MLSLNTSQKRFAYKVDRFLYEKGKPLREVSNGKGYRVALIHGPFRPTFNEVAKYDLEPFDVGSLYFFRFGLIVETPSEIVVKVAYESTFADQLYEKEAKKLGLL